MNAKTANSYHRGPGGIINIMLRCFLSAFFIFVHLFAFVVHLFGCIFVLLVLLVLLVLFVRAKCFCKKNKINKEFKTALTTSFILLLNSSYYNFYYDYYDFFKSQSFSIITIFFSYHNTFEWLQYFSIITILFNNHNLFNYYNLWHYFCENNSKYKFHHLNILFIVKAWQRYFFNFICS